MNNCCCDHHGGCGSDCGHPQMYSPIYVWPVSHSPVCHCTCGCGCDCGCEDPDDYCCDDTSSAAGPGTAKLPKETEVDPTNSSKEAMVGGLQAVDLTLEYIGVSDKDLGVISVDITTPSGDVTHWKTSSVAHDAYVIKTDLAPASPGDVVKVKGNKVVARLRWFETVTC
ncbi:MAG: hypothetical protein GY847_34510 [Proteobacteria bacterium]|nr:hypothetical protein [Pseudomonadota bacterium]